MGAANTRPLLIPVNIKETFQIGCIDMFKIIMTTLLLLSQVACSALPHKKDSYLSNMQYIRGGSFLMGSPTNEEERRKDERQHLVYVDDFWIEKKEVTYDQWKICVDDGGCQSNIYPVSAGYRSSGSPDLREKHPVSNVSWDDANEYTHWLSKKTGKNYRLPTEAEWEYAARAGTKTAYPWGNTMSEDRKVRSKLVICGFCGNEGSRVSPATVGSLRAYGGLYDMHGNVAEWTCSSYKKNYDNDTEKKCSSPKDRRLKVARGGTFDSPLDLVRSAFRRIEKPETRSALIGFRVVREK